MKIAHLSDTHLGYRAYAAETFDHRNQREIDVMASFEAVLRSILDYDPDLVVHAGDLFHVVRPSNNTLFDTFRLLRAFQDKRRHGDDQSKYKPFVIVGGNHDAPRLNDTGNALALMKFVQGVSVAADEAAYFDFPDQDCAVLGMPYEAVRRKETSLIPTIPRKYNILALHGLVTQLGLATADLDLEETHHRRWDYVALGDFHTHQTYDDHTCYSGSTDFTAKDIWSESQSQKGWVSFDTETKKIKFHPLQTRKVIDCPVINAIGLSGEEIAEQMLANANWKVQMPIVRQRIINLDPVAERAIPYEILASLKRSALHYVKEPTRPSRTDSAAKGGAEGARIDLVSQWQSHVTAALIPAEVDRQAVAELGKQILEEVKEREADKVEA